VISIAPLADEVPVGTCTQLPLQAGHANALRLKSMNEMSEMSVRFNVIDVFSSGLVARFDLRY
jgi:hypothetical protein